MKVTVSTAVSADGYLDDRSPDRLILSTPEDWAEVHRLRAACDAILVGAETIRRDNPSLLVGDEVLRRERIDRGLSPDPVKVTLTASCRLSPEAKFFTRGDQEKIVFTTCPDPGSLQQVATVIPAAEITAALIVTELEKRGLRSLLVEGGAATLRMFFAENLVDTFRLAVNPAVKVGDPRAPRLEIGSNYLQTPHSTESLGGMRVTTYAIKPDRTAEDRRYLQMAIDESRKCTPSTSSYCVGAVIVTTNRKIFTGYTHETSPTHHAEQEAILKALAAGVELRGATIYSSMEPCSERKSEPESCSELIIRHEFRRVVFCSI
jgi:rib_reduct_arch: diaminohydroxyphosphoribosylaminopyrimidine reductase